MTHDESPRANVVAAQNVAEQSSVQTSSTPKFSVASDLLSGVVVAVVCLPFCIGFGLMAFAPLGPGFSAMASRAGLVGGMVAGLLSALLGGTRGQISAPIVAGALIIAELVGTLLHDPTLPVAPEARSLVCLGAVALTVACAGALQIGFGALRLGAAARYLAYPVITGLMAAIAILTAKGQLAEFFGPGGYSGWSNAPLSSVALCTLAIGIAVVIVVVRGAKWLPRVPGPLQGLVLGIFISELMRLVHAPSVPMLESSSSALPSPIDPLPALHLALSHGGPWFAQHLIGPALSIALFSSLNSLLASSAVDAVSGHTHDPHRELIGQGAGNLAASAFAGIPCGGLASLSTLNWRMGGRTRWVGVAYGLTLFCCLVIGGPLLARIPKVALAAIVVVTAARLFDPWIFKLCAALVDSRRKADRADTLVSLGLVSVVTASVLGAGLVWGIVLGMLASSVHFMFSIGRIRYRLAYRGNQVHSKCVRSPEELAALGEHGASIAVFELGGAIFFGSADRLLRRVERDATGASTIILGLRAVDEIDASGLRVLLSFMARLQRGGCRVLIGHLTTGHSLWPRLADMGVHGSEIERHFFASTDEALEYAEQELLASLGHQPDVSRNLALAETELLRGLPQELIEWCEEHVTWQSFGSGEVVLNAGAAERNLYILTQGRVSVEAGHTNGESTRLASFGAGTAFGEIALFDSGPRSATVVAQQAVTCAVLSAQAVNQLSESNPALALRLLTSLSRGLAHRLRAATGQIQTLSQ